MPRISSPRSTALKATFARFSPATVSGGKIACAAAAALLLAGCSTFGEKSPSAAPAASSDNSFMNLFKYGSTTPPPIKEMEIVDFDFDCPSVEILEGAAALRQMAGGTVRSQISIGQTARECRVNGNQVTMKVGIEGRALLGTGGSPGTFVAPVRIVIKSGDKVLVSRLVRQSVTIPPNDTQATFVVIEDNMVVPKSDLTLLVGLDPNGRAEPVARRKKKGG
jgi:hypothetical protein